jgi:hypothetical protein
MKPEEIVTSLEWSKKLRDAGYPQEYKVGNFVWFLFGNPDDYRLELCTGHGTGHNCEDCQCECRCCYPYGNKGGIVAPHAEEILRRLPIGWEAMRNTELEHHDTYGIRFTEPNGWFKVNEDTLADAAAACYCYLAERNLPKDK